MTPLLISAGVEQINRPNDRAPVDSLLPQPALSVVCISRLVSRCFLYRLLSTWYTAV